MFLELDVLTNLDHYEESHCDRALICDAIILIKNVLSNDFCDQIKNELYTWKQSTPAMEERDAQKQSIKNYHTSITSNEYAKKSSELNFIVGKTQIEAHNYRISDFSDNHLKATLPTLFSNISTLMKLFNSLVGDKGFIKNTDSNSKLHLEFVHFPAGKGYVELHTHQTMVNNGLVLSILFLLSKKGVDYTSGGVTFVKNGKELDLSDSFSKGDLVIFNNMLPHYVSKITGIDSGTNGRWIMSFYYY